MTKQQQHGEANVLRTDTKNTCYSLVGTLQVVRLVASRVWVSVTVTFVYAYGSLAGGFGSRNNHLTTQVG